MKKIILDILNLIIWATLILVLLKATNVIASEPKLFWDVRNGKIYHCIKTNGIEKCSEFPSRFFKNRVLIIKVIKVINAKEA